MIKNKRMTKQEKVRAGIAKLYKEETGTIIDAYQKEEWEEAYNFADQLRICLHSQGVVIKVEGELPNAPIPCPEPIPNDLYFYRGYEKAKEDMAGYVAVEPLIEGK